MAQQPNPARERVRRIVPKMIELSEQVIYGDIWERPGLSKRDRSLIVVATLIATYRPEQLKGHLGRALDNGVTKDEIAEIITHLAFYSGWPASVTARRIAAEVYEERGLREWLSRLSIRLRERHSRQGHCEPIAGNAVGGATSAHALPVRCYAGVSRSTASMGWPLPRLSPVSARGQTYGSSRSALASWAGAVKSVAAAAAGIYRT